MALSYLHDSVQQAACLCADGEAFGPVISGIDDARVIDQFIDWLAAQGLDADPMLSTRVLAWFDQFRSMAAEDQPVMDSRRKPPMPSARLSPGQWRKQA